MAQLDFGNKHEEVPSGAWLHAREAPEGFCFKQWRRSCVYFHNRQPKGHVLFPVLDDGSLGPVGEIIYPDERLAVFEFEK